MHSVLELSGRRPSEEFPLLSLKANSKLLNGLQSSFQRLNKHVNEGNDAISRDDDDTEIEHHPFIEFTSTTTARIVVGSEEYELKFCDVNPTVSHILCFFPC